MNELPSVVFTTNSFLESEWRRRRGEREWKLKGINNIEEDRGCCINCKGQRAESKDQRETHSHSQTFQSFHSFWPALTIHWPGFPSLSLSPSNYHSLLFLNSSPPRSFHGASYYCPYCFFFPNCNFKYFFLLLFKFQCLANKILHHILKVKNNK